MSDIELMTDDPHIFAAESLISSLKSENGMKCTKV